MSDNEEKERNEDGTASDSARATSSGTRLRRLLRAGALGLAGIVGLAAVTGAGTLFFLRSDMGEAWLTRTVNGAMMKLPSGMSAHVDSVSGPVPSRILLTGITLSDEQGLWLKAAKAELRLDWSALPQALVVAELSLDDPGLLRLPELLPSEEDTPPSPPVSLPDAARRAEAFFRSWPDWLPELRIDRLSILRATLPDALISGGLQATFNATASLNRDGVRMSADLARNDVDCRPLQIEASLSPELRLSLEGQGSDLGLLAQLPDGPGKNTGVRFTLSGKGTPERMETGITARLADGDSDMVTATASATLQLLDALPQASASLTIDSAEGISRLWSLAGQKNGGFRMSVNAKALQRQDELTMQASAALTLSDMEWGDPALNDLLGPSCVLKSVISADKGKDNLIHALLDELSLHSERLQALVHGTLNLSGSEPFLSPATNVILHTACTLADAGTLTPDLSGAARFSGDLSGTPEALSAALRLSGDKLKISGIVLEDMHAGMDIPHADVPHLMKELPRLTAEIGKGLFGRASDTEKQNGDGKSDTPDTTDPSGAEKMQPSPTGDVSGSPAPRPILHGHMHAAARVNGQKTSFETLWNVEEHGDPSGGAMLFTLEDCALHVEDNVLEGRLRADVPFRPSDRQEGTVAALLGMTPPSMDGEVTVSTPHWTALAAVSGLKLSGSPLNAHLTLSSQDRPSLDWKGDLSSFRLSDARGNVSLSGLKTALTARDLWGKPEVSLHAELGALKTPGLSLSRISAAAQGNAAGAKISWQSHGDVRSELLAGWKPGELTLNTFTASVSSALLGLSGTDPAGLALSRPASIRFRDDTIAVPDLALAFQPAGQIVLSGSWSPKAMRMTAALDSLDLERFRSLFPELPSGTLECRADMEGSLQAPTGNFKLNLNNIHVPGSPVPPVSADLSGRLGITDKRRMLTVTLELPEESRKALGLTESDVRLQIPFTTPATGTALPDMKGPLRGDVVLDGELGQLWKIIPLTDQRLAGQVHLTAVLSGTPAAPVLTLRGAVDNGRFAELVQGVELRNIRLRMDADRLALNGRAGDRLTLSLSADDSRQGTVSMNGWFEPSGMKLLVSGSLEHLSPLRRQDVNIMLSGDLSVSGTVTDPDVRADITVDKGQIQLARLPGGDIVTLPIEEPGQKKQTQAVPLQGSLNVRVRIPNQFFIRGYGLECEWKGDIRARGSFARPNITGGIQAVRGGLDVLGKHFDLAEGNISFDGGWPVSPVLDIVMEYESSSITADVTVSGSATKPDIALSSQPSLPQDEIISQIMFGQSAGNLSHVQALQLAAGAAQLAGLGGTDVMGLGRRILGLDVFKLNSENTSSSDGSQDMTKTSLEMGTYVRDNVYVGVEQGIGRESETDAVVEIELTPSLEAQAKASANRTEVGLEWKKNY